MKKLFTFIASALIALGVNAQTELISYNGEGTLPTGITVTGTTTQSTVKINSNKNSVNCLKLANGYSASGKFNGNSVNVFVDGGFKAGDTLKIKGVINNSDASKWGSVRAFAVKDDAIDSLTQSSNFINSRTVADDPTFESLILKADCDTLRLGRNGNTGTCILAFSVVRPAEVQADTTYYIVDATATATYKSATNDATFKNQTVKTFTKNGVLCATIPAASVTGIFSPMPMAVTFTLPETTIEGLQKDQAGNISLIEGVAPVVNFTVSVGKVSVPGTASVKSVSGAVDDEGNLNLTVNADYSAVYAAMGVELNGQLVVVYTTASATGVNNATVAAKTLNGKFIENGRVVIVKNGNKYNVSGALLK